MTLLQRRNNVVCPVGVSNLMKHLEHRPTIFSPAWCLSKSFLRTAASFSLPGPIANSTTQTDTLIMDFSKAFDKVPRNRLNYKLNWYGIRGDTLECITDLILSSRSQRVLLAGATSDSTLSGVFQWTHTFLDPYQWPPWWGRNHYSLLIRWWLYSLLYYL